MDGSDQLITALLPLVAVVGADGVAGTDAALRGIVEPLPVDEYAEDPTALVARTLAVTASPTSKLKGAAIKLASETVHSLFVRIVASVPSQLACATKLPSFFWI